ncbi:hypothetical protein NC651_008531 [Populus alba x Populus x berolinensis]|nr:hypothetical protein NC651_008531 [Populus alba x Populus x berolinensis]
MLPFQIFRRGFGFGPGRNSCRPCYYYRILSLEALPTRHESQDILTTDFMRLQKHKPFIQGRGRWDSTP